MKWITRERAKVDRVACPWLISRFIDPHPEFLYVPADQVLAEAEREGWLGEVEGLKVSLAGADDKLAQIDQRSHNEPVHLGVPGIPVPRQPHDPTHP